MECYSSYEFSEVSIKIYKFSQSQVNKLIKYELFHNSTLL